MTSIHTLIPDIQSLLKTEGWMTEELSKEFSHEVSQRLQQQYEGRTKAPTLRLSQMGPRCPKALWCSIHTPGEAEPLPPWANFKYSFGHIIEALAVTLAKAAGHEVTGEQDELIVDGIVGHRDCVIDGCIVDVKSAASFSFNKFKDGSIKQTDSFGYLDQLDGYLCGSLEDPLVRVKDRAYLLAIDKQLGHMALYQHEFREQHIRDRIRQYKEIVARDTPPACECGTTADGKSGNIRLDTKASYNQYKYCCFPSLRTFLYADGPKYLTQVNRRPDVIEIDKYGKVLYN
jgi:hypothetical protein